MDHLDKAGILLIIAGTLDALLIVISIVTIHFVIKDMDQVLIISQAVFVMVLFLPAALMGILGGVLTLKKRYRRFAFLCAIILVIAGLSEGIFRLIFTSFMFGWGSLLTAVLGAIACSIMFGYWNNVRHQRDARIFERNRDYLKAYDLYRRLGMSEDVSRVLNILVLEARYKGNRTRAIQLLLENGQLKKAKELKQEMTNDKPPITPEAYKKIVQAFGYETAMNYSRAEKLFTQLSMKEDAARCRKLQSGAETGEDHRKTARFSGRKGKDGGKERNRGFNEFGELSN